MWGGGLTLIACMDIAHRTAGRLPSASDRTVAACMSAATVVAGGIVGYHLSRKPATKEPEWRTRIHVRRAGNVAFCFQIGGCLLFLAIALLTRPLTDIERLAAMFGGAILSIAIGNRIGTRLERAALLRDPPVDLCGDACEHPIVVTARAAKERP